jgi:hypothetical protein
MAGFTLKCEPCDGKGEIAGPGGEVVGCRVCHGKGRVKRSGGTAAHQELAKVEILPPDPVTQDRREQPMPPSLAGMETPGIADWRRGMNPRAVRRRIQEALRDMSPDSMRALDGLIKHGGGDSRVQLAAVALHLSYVNGKPGEGAFGGDEAAGGVQGTPDLRFATPDERARLAEITSEVAAIFGRVRERIAAAEAG